MPTENEKKPTLAIVCIICRKPLTDPYGHNAQPIMEGRCCDDCNSTVVIPTRLRRLRNTGMALLAFLIFAPDARAQQTTVYGADGRAVSRTVTGSNGSTTTYDAASGKPVARTTTSPTTGTTTIYDAATGSKAGSIVHGGARR